MVGPKKQDFWPRINILEGFFILNPSMNYDSSKSAKIVLSKSIFDVKNSKKPFVTIWHTWDTQLFTHHPNFKSF